MKAIFDIDGTLTDFNKYIKENAIPYFKKNYGMEERFVNQLEVEDIFDMDNHFAHKNNCDIDIARKLTKEALSKYWKNIFRFIKFTFYPFRKGTRCFIKKLKKQDFDIEMHTSRAFSCEHNFIGKIVRAFTYLQILSNGIYVPFNKLKFYSSDKEKLDHIIKVSPDIVIDDKPIIINVLAENHINVICVRGSHNTEIVENKKLFVISDFASKEEVAHILGKISDKRVAIQSRIKKSNRLYSFVRLSIPLILGKFKPIILHKENLNIKLSSGLVVAPNHQSTLDPLIITSIIDKNIHWAALKRFFDGKDSIFNNSKNKVLCKITSVMFKKMEYFPIDRLKDNPKANNMKSIKEMIAFLKEKQCIGIFPEGTTNKTEEDFGTFDPAFVACAKNTSSYIMPITVQWCKEHKNKLIVNIGKPFATEKLSKEELFNYFLLKQKEQLEENRSVIKSLNKKAH